MKIIGVDYDDGKTVGLDVLCDGDQRVHFARVTDDAVSKEELLKLRDDLYANDQITMKGLAKMNRLIYGVKK